jgi:hypothetical protein
MSRSVGSPISAELGLAEEARIVPVPTSGNEYVCPNCERPIPTRKQVRLAKPAKYEGVLNDVFKCPFDNFIFSPKSTAVVLMK